MALPKIDNFTTSSDQRISTYNASWVENNASEWTVRDTTDDVYTSKAGTASEGACHWEGDVFNNNQYAQVKIDAVANGRWIGPAVRVAAGATSTYYGYYGQTGDSYLFKSVVGVITAFGSAGGGFSIGSTYRVEANSTTLTPKKDGVTADIGAQTDSGISSGYAGMSCAVASANTRADDFEGGNLGGVTSPKRMKALVLGV